MTRRLEFALGIATLMARVIHAAVGFQAFLEIDPTEAVGARRRSVARFEHLGVGGSENTTVNETHEAVASNTIGEGIEQRGSSSKIILEDAVLLCVQGERRLRAAVESGVIKER